MWGSVDPHKIISVHHSLRKKLIPGDQSHQDSCLPYSLRVFLAFIQEFQFPRHREGNLTSRTTLIHRTHNQRFLYTDAFLHSSIQKYLRIWAGLWSVTASLPFLRSTKISIVLLDAVPYGSQKIKNYSSDKYVCCNSTKFKEGNKFEHDNRNIHSKRALPGPLCT